MVAARGARRVFTDADLAYPVAEIDAMVRELDSGADVAIACRVLPESRYLMSPSFFHYLYTRHVMSRLFNRVVRIALLPGILEANAAGVVSSVSVLVNAPGWAHAVAALPAAASTLGAGLHLNLTAGEPVSSGGSLVHPRTGRFYGLAGLMARALAGRIDAGHVAEECAAQLARLRA